MAATGSQWWQVTPKEAIALQQQLRARVSLDPLDKKITLVAGADVSLNMFEKDIYAGIIVLSYPSLEVVDYAVVKSRTEMPYIPGLLSFREVPALMECLAKLKTKPDLIVVDGQGIAHPRRLGIASHFGVLADIPTIGCGKSRLYGTYEEPIEPGTWTDIVDPSNGEVIGSALKSKARSKPLIISPGHKVSVAQAREIIQNSLRGYRLPEETRKAHELVNKFRTGVL
jgi:deoxyribonuclease V